MDNTYIMYHTFIICNAHKDTHSLSVCLSVASGKAFPQIFPPAFSLPYPLLLGHEWAGPSRGDGQPQGRFAGCL